MYKSTIKRLGRSAVRAAKIFNETKSALRFLGVFQKIQNFPRIFSTNHFSSVSSQLEH